MQKENNQFKCHSRKLLSGICTLGIKSGGAPRTLRAVFSSLMTPTRTRRHAEFISASSRYDNNQTLKQVQGDGMKGFTLIELLVVVLIIGILAAVALPQYQKAVEKSKAAEAFVVLKSVYPAVQSYYMEHGEWPTSFSQLDVKIPYTGNKQWSSIYSKDARSNPDWSLQLYNSIGDSGNSAYLVMGRIAGRYQGGGFIIGLAGATSGPVAMQITCAERKNRGIIFQGEPGDYCEKLFHGTKRTPEANTFREYILP